VSSSEVNRGAGAARNAAVNQSSGVVLVIQVSVSIHGELGSVGMQ
jgi:hypothetical protein